MMKYYATVKSNNSVSKWEKIEAKNATQAKRKAGIEFGGGYIGDMILLAEVHPDFDASRLNDIVYFRKAVLTNARWSKYQS